MMVVRVDSATWRASLIGFSERMAVTRSVCS